MIAKFSDDEKTLLKGKASSLANKHECSNKYIHYIINGVREVNSELSKKIYADLKALVELLTPETTK